MYSYFLLILNKLLCRTTISKINSIHKFTKKLQFFLIKSINKIMNRKKKSASFKTFLISSSSISCSFAKYKSAVQNDDREKNSINSRSSNAAGSFRGI